MKEYQKHIAEAAEQFAAIELKRLEVARSLTKKLGLGAGKGDEFLWEIPEEVQAAYLNGEIDSGIWEKQLAIYFLSEWK